MASFSYSALHIYSATENNTIFITTDDEAGVASDLEGDTTFEIGDSTDYTLDDPTNGGAPFTANASYIGFIDFAGLSLPVAFVPVSELPGAPSDLQDAFPDGVYVVADPRDPNTITAPASLDVSSIDAGPFTVCFLAGTAITTPSGTAAVETLKTGDPILTSDGRTVAVKWVGRQTISTRFGPAHRKYPVCITAGALGAGVPCRDLRLTADHAVEIDGLLVNAGALVNGTTITHETRDTLGDSFTVYHIETAAHDVILAEGTPAETFVDYVGRQSFDNHAEYMALYGDEAALPELDRPRITTARMLPYGLRARLGIDHAA